jgi:hypothetical protein
MATPITIIGSDSHWPMLITSDRPKMPSIRFAEELGNEAEGYRSRSGRRPRPPRVVAVDVLKSHSIDKQQHRPSSPDMVQAARGAAAALST